MSEPVIKLKNICKSFGDNVVLDKINFSIEKGEILTLMGGSGVGKSVILRSIIGLEQPDRGEIYFHGENIVGLNEEDFTNVRKRIAYVFQYGALFDSFTVFENLAYPLREHTNLEEDEIQEKVAVTLEKVSLSGSENLLPADLSGGMQRRVGVARSIIMDPEVIIYDEPTTGLDPYNTQQILKSILQLKEQGATSVLVTHDMSSAFAVTDRVAFLKDSKIRNIGTTKEIRNTKDPVLRGFLSGETM